MDHYRTWNEATSHLVIEEFVRQGITSFFLAPGSRSTPLVLAASAHPKITITPHFDERGLGFLALGASKATGTPSVLITTSGSAVANLLPAVVEAYQSNTPLILLTADRPFELLDNGANQAISQNTLFKDFVCQQFSIPESHSKTSIPGLLSKIGFGIYQCKKLKKPLQVNWHFQEPLSPMGHNEDVQISQEVLSWSQGSQPWTLFEEQTLPSDISTASKILICAGGFLSDSEQNTILQIAEHLQAPIFWDVQTSLRFQSHPLNIAHFDWILEKKKPEAQWILHFGSSMTSKNVNQWISQSQAQYIRIYPELENRDFLNKRKIVFNQSYEKVLEQIQTLVPEPRASQGQDSSWTQSLREEVLQISQILKEEASLSEATLPYHLTQELSATNLFVGSSRPIRDLERFGSTASQLKIFSNRGASGIDGNLATAIGMAQATNTPTLAYMGDLTFLYDLNSLEKIQNLKQHFKILVVNNEGGGIFSFLPVAKIPPETFQKYFHTSHNVELRDFASAFQLRYFSIQNVSELKEALSFSGHALIEFQTQTPKTLDIHKTLLQKYLDL